MVQLELPLSRSSDHISSFAAIDTLSKSGELKKQRDKVMANLTRFYLNNFIWPTSKQLACYFGMDRHIVARRLPDLETLGMVERRICTINETPAMTWRVK